MWLVLDMHVDHIRPKNPHRFVVAVYPEEQLIDLFFFHALVLFFQIDLDITASALLRPQGTVNNPSNALYDFDQEIQFVTPLEWSFECLDSTSSSPRSNLFQLLSQIHTMPRKNAARTGTKGHNAF